MALTQEQLKDIDRELNNNAEYKKLQAQYFEAQKRHQFIQAGQYYAKMQKISEAARKDLMKMQSTEYVKICDTEARMNYDVAQLFRTRLIAACMCVDMIDTCVIEMDECLQSLNEDMHIDAFETLCKVGHEAKACIQLMVSESEQHRELWQDMMESIERYIFMRATAHDKKEQKLTLKLAKKNGTKETA